MIRALIFDLCDTVVRTAGLPGLPLLPGVTDPSHVRRLEQWFGNSAEFLAFERGEIGAAAFLSALRKGTGLHATDDALGRAFEGLILHEIEGVAPLLRQLAAEYPLYALSNNNELLWRGIQRVCTTLDVFEQVFLSQEIGLLKPGSCGLPLRAGADWLSAARSRANRRQPALRGRSRGVGLGDGPLPRRGKHRVRIGADFGKSQVSCADT